MATLSWAGLDVHARSTEAAALDAASGELTRRRFGGGTEAVVAWLAGLPQPVRACYEAGPTGYALPRRPGGGHRDAGDRPGQDAPGRGRPRQERPQGR